MSAVSRKPSLENSFCTEILLKVTEESMSAIFEIPSTSFGKKFTWHEIFVVFWWKFEMRLVVS